MCIRTSPNERSLGVLELRRDGRRIKGLKSYQHEGPSFITEGGGDLRIQGGALRKSEGGSGGAKGRRSAAGWDSCQERQTTRLLAEIKSVGASTSR